MCITSQPAALSSTLGLIARTRVNDFDVRLVAYQNRATSLSADGRNAMILHFPSAIPLGPENMIDATGWPSFLSYLDSATRPVTRGTRSATTRSVQVFAKGSYHVVVTDDPMEVESALLDVPDDVRPIVPRAVIEWYARYRVGYQIAVCCWRGEIQAEPLVWWYHPGDPDVLHFPAADAHDGGAPKPGVVARDHTVFVGISDDDWYSVWRKDEAIRPSDADPVIWDLLPDALRRYDYDSSQNGDFLYTLNGWSLDGRSSGIASVGVRYYVGTVVS